MVVALSVCVVGACSQEATHSSPGSSSVTKAGQLGGNGKTGGQCNGGNAPGCPCAAGKSVACWTGPSEDRNSGACHDGTQTCTSSGEGEQSTWGPCQGEQLDCDGGPDAAPDVADAGKSDAGGFLVAQNASAGGGMSPCSVLCTGCVPGAVIGCYDDCNLKAYCDTTATETCLPNGTWGPCTETGGGPGGGLPSRGPSAGGASSDASSDASADSSSGAVTCYEFWGNCSNYNDGAGSYAGQCDSVFAGCASPFSTTCPGSSDTSQLGAGAPDIPDAGIDASSTGTSACETAGGYCLPATDASNCASSGGVLTADSCAGSASGGTACCDFGSATP